MILERINSNLKNEDIIDEKNIEVMLEAELKIISNEKTFYAKPIYGIQGNSVANFEAVVEDAGLRFKFISVDPKTGKITLEIAEKDSSGDFIIMKAIVFPWINLVWAGTIILIIGFMLSIWKRLDHMKAKSV